MNKFNKEVSTLVGIIIIIVVAVIFFGGVFAYQYFAIKANNQLQVQNQTAGPALSEVEGWKTYTNTKYGFEIHYPVGSQIKDNLDSNSPGISFTLPDSTSGQSHIFYVYVATQAWYNLGTPNAVFESPANCADFNSDAATSLVNINGVNFTKGDVSSASAALRSNSTEYCVVRGKIAYKLTPSIQYGPDYGDATQYNAKGFNTTIDVNNDPVLNQMLSTFKFTALTDQNAGWKTYTNTQYGLEISYPSSWPNPKEEKSPGLGITWDYSIHFTKESTGNNIVTNIPGLDIEITHVSSDVSIDQNLITGLSLKSTYIENSCPKISSNVKIGIGSYSAQEVYILTNNSCYREGYFYGIRRGDYFYRIIPVPVNGIGYAGYDGKIEVSKTLPEFYQIISTFKFIPVK